MKVVALVSGGKDSVFNAMHCVANGHEIVALAHLCPPRGHSSDELDSFMFQTVGHTALSHFSDCFGLPLFQEETTGKAHCSDKQYERTSDADEVEDLFRLLSRVVAAIPDITAVSAGAILSDYQRVRVEHVCIRLGLTSLAYLWSQPQDVLLRSMLDHGIDAVLVKVAAWGLDPARHLGRHLGDLYDELLVMGEKYSLNVAGEGGEYETIVLDCPLFKRRLVLDETKVVRDPSDRLVAHLSIISAHTEPKEAPQISVEEALAGLRVSINDYIAPYLGDNWDHVDEVEVDHVADSLASTTISDHVDNTVASKDPNKTSTDSNTHSSTNFSSNHVANIPPNHMAINPLNHVAITVHRDVICVSNLASFSPDAATATHEVLSTLASLLRPRGASLSSIISVMLVVRSMKVYAAVNAAYGAYFSVDPPSRAAVACESLDATVSLSCIAQRTSSMTSSIDRDTSSAIDTTTSTGNDTTTTSSSTTTAITTSSTTGNDTSSSSISSSTTTSHPTTTTSSSTTPFTLPSNAPRTHMHVQSISNWSPANIGPYSQSASLGALVISAGQIGLIPSTMSRDYNDTKDVEVHMALRNAAAVIEKSGAYLKDVFICVCAAISHHDANMAIDIWNRQGLDRESLIVTIVSELPRGSRVEWWPFAIKRNIHGESVKVVRAKSVAESRDDMSDVDDVLLAIVTDEEMRNDLAGKVAAFVVPGRPIDKRVVICYRKCDQDD